MSKTRIVLIGAGRMGSALASGWLAGEAPPHLTIIEPNPSELIEGWADSGDAEIGSPPEQADIIVIAVKPQVFADVQASIAEWVGERTLIVSIMAGIQLRRLAEAFGTERVVRVMPNTPGAIGQGVCLVAPHAGALSSDMDTVRGLLEPLGLVEGPLSEADMSAATAISGCGPAYVFLLAEVMAMAGEAEGLAPDLAKRIAEATVTGAAALMDASAESPEALRKAVTSPGGVTRAALDVLMDDHGVPQLMRKAVKAAVQRDRELARSE